MKRPAKRNPKSPSLQNRQLTSDVWMQIPVDLAGASGCALLVAEAGGIQLDEDLAENLSFGFMNFHPSTPLAQSSTASRRRRLVHHTNLRLASLRFFAQIAVAKRTVAKAKAVNQIRMCGESVGSE